MTGWAGSHSPQHGRWLLQCLPTTVGQPRRPSSQSRVSVPGDPGAGQPGPEVPRPPLPREGRLRVPGQGRPCPTAATPQPRGRARARGHGSCLLSSLPLQQLCTLAGAPPSSGPEHTAIGVSPACRVAWPALASLAQQPHKARLPPGQHPADTHTHTRGPAGTQDTVARDLLPFVLPLESWRL